MRSAWLWFLVLAACSGSGKNTPASKKGPLTPKDIVQRSSPAIVRVEVGEGSDVRGSGTGFILDKSGLIATNFHVVKGSSNIKVKLYGGDEYQVLAIAGVDPGRDLALLRIQPTKALPTLRLGDSDAMSAGDQIIAIGNPLGVFDYSVSSGLVSQVRPVCTVDMVALHQANVGRFEELVKKGRNRSEAEDVELTRLSCTQELKILQISAPISKGSSGGPLFNQQGEVVGVTTAIIDGGQNINLAIPGNYLKPIVAKPGTISLQEFAKETGGGGGDDGDNPRGRPQDDGERVVREVPDHPVAVLEGCKREQVGDLVKTIWETIEVGAPVYNQASNVRVVDDATKAMRDRYYEACYQIYEGTAKKFEQNPPCKGVKQAFADGLKRAGTMKSFKLKAWAMRDAFDGLLDVSKDWATANGVAIPKSSK